MESDCSLAWTKKDLNLIMTHIRSKTINQNRLFRLSIREIAEEHAFAAIIMRTNVLIVLSATKRLTIAQKCKSTDLKFTVLNV